MSFYLFVSILCAKIMCVKWALAKKKIYRIATGLSRIFYAQTLVKLKTLVWDAH